MKTIRVLLLSTAFAMPGAAFAEAATQAGADELTTLFQTYLGTTPGVVTVAPEGETYGVKLDLAALFAKVPVEGFEAAMTPIRLTLTDNGDGTWAYAVDQPLSLTYAVPGDVAMKAKTSYGSLKVTGLFDESLGDSTTIRVETADIASEQVQTQPGVGDIVTKTLTKSAVMEGGAKAGAAGVDGVWRQTMSGMSIETMIPGPEPLPITAEVADGALDLTMTGYDPKDLYSLLAWFIAHPGEEAIKADKTGLKAEIDKTLPVFANLAMTGGYRSLTVDTPVGLFAASEIAVAVDMNGAVPDGKFREAISFTGFTMPEGLVPPFAQTLVPSEFSIDFAATGFDAAAPAALALGLLDLPDGTEPSPEFGGQMLSAFLPDGTVDITLAPGGVTAPDYRLTYEGAMTAGPAMPMPVGTAKVTLVGMEAIQKALQSAPPEMGMGQAMMGLGMAGGMAKPGAEGELVWEVEMTEAGAILVNGVDMQQMMGGQ